MTDLRGQWALVTGASSGIGADVARELADRGVNLVLVARRESRLQEVAAELRREHGILAEVESADLASEGAPRKLFASLAQRERTIDILVNNAGFAYHGEFIEQDPERLRSMVMLQTVNVMEMTWLFARAMAERGHGHVLNVASITGLMPVPGYAAYGATKAFITNFSDAISWELRERGVHVTSVLPGATWTEFFEVSGQEITLYNRVTGMESREVARIGVSAMLRRRGSVVAGWWNNIGVALAACFPRRAKAWVTWRLNRND